MKLIALFFLLLTACEGEDMRSPTFFEKYGASELGSTKFITSSWSYGVRGQNQKMIDVSVEDAAACPVIVSIRTEYAIAPATVIPTATPGTGTVTQGAVSIGGPVVATVLFGVGGGQNQVEFDVPSPRWPDRIAPLGITDGNSQPMNNNGNGVQVYLGGASHVSVYVRNDGSVSSLANILNLTPAAPTDHIGNETPAKVIVHIQPASSSGGPAIERTIWVAGGVLNLAASAIAPNNQVYASIPPFAKSVRVQRIPEGGPITLKFADNTGHVYRTIDLGPNDEGPINFDSATDTIGFQNTGAANITQLQAVFNVTPA